MKKSKGIIIMLIIMIVMTGAKRYEREDIEDIYFKIGSAKIDKVYNARLDELAERIKQEKDVEYQLLFEGYTDYIGSEKANLALSKRRAEALKEYFVKKHKLSPKIFETKYYGKKQYEGKKTAADRKKNRRVAVSIEKLRFVSEEKEIVKYKVGGIEKAVEVEVQGNEIRVGFAYRSEIEKAETEIEYKGVGIEPEKVEGDMYRKEFVIKVKAEDDSEREYKVIPVIRSPEVKLEIGSDKNEIKSNGEDKVKLTYRLTKDEYEENGEVIYYANGEEIEGDEFVTKESGEYTIYGESGGVRSNEIKVNAVEVVEEVKVEIEKPLEIIKELRLTADRYTLKADGIDKAGLKAIYMENGEDKIDKVITIYVNGEEQEGKEITSDIPRKIEIIAKTGEIKSNKIEIEAVEDEEAFSIELEVEKREILNNGKDKSRLQAVVKNRMGRAIKTEKSIEYYVDDKKIEGKNVTSEKIGEIKTYAKIGEIQSNIEKIDVKDEIEQIEIKTDKEVLRAGGEDKAELEVIITDILGNKIERAYEIKRVASDEAVVIEGNKVSRKKSGEIEIYAEFKGRQSNIIKIRAVGYPAKIVVSSERTEMYSHMGETSRIYAKVYDEEGNELDEKYVIKINGRVHRNDIFEAKLMGKYELTAETGDLRSNKAIINVRPGYERYKMTLHGVMGDKFPQSTGYILGKDIDEKTIYMYPGSGDIYGIDFQYDINSFIEVEAGLNILNAAPDPQMKNVKSGFTTLGISGEIKLIPLRFEYSRIKIGIGGAYKILNEYGIDYVESGYKISGKIDYKPAAYINISGEYEHFLMNDRLSISPGVKYEAGKTLMDKGKLNDFDVTIDDVKEYYQIIDYTGVGIYLKAGWHF